MTHDEGVDRSGKPSAVLLGIVVAGVIGLLGYVLWSRFRPPAPPVIPRAVSSPELSPVELEAANQQARLAIGYLENEKFADAAQLFEQLAEKLPDEPIVARNLAICRVLEVESPTGSPDLASVDQAISALEKADPDSGVTHWLAARVQLKLYEKNLASESGKTYQAAALEKLRRAIELAPRNAAYWFEIFQAGRETEDPSVRDEARRALDQCYRLAPRNLRVVIEWLYDHVQEKKGPELAQSLPNFRKLVEPIAPGIERRSKRNLLTFFDELQAAVDRQQWQAARSAVTKIRNLLASEELTRSDLRRVLKNPLEFVVYSLKPETLRRLPAPAAPRQPIAVRFVETWQGHELPSEIVAARLVEFDFDGRPDLVVLRQELVEVWQVQPDGSLGSRSVSTPVPQGMATVLAADLDRDMIATRGAVKAASQLTDPKQAFYDADADLVVFGAGGIRVLQNMLADDGQTRTLTVVPQDPEFDALRDITAGTLADIDHDGDLDLILSVNGQIQVWWSRDNLTFENATRWSQLPPAETRIESLAAVDWDRDVDIDILVSGVNLPSSGVLENLRHGQLQWRPFDETFADVGSAAWLVPCEVDGNTSWDVVSAGPSGIHTVLTTTVPGQSVGRLRSESIDSRPFRRAFVLDYDNDGTPDVLASGEGEAALFRGQIDGTLAPTFAPVNETLPAAAGFSVADADDVDADGDLDLLTLSAGKLGLLRNDGGNQNHWLRVRVRGEAEERSGRVNHFGIGSLLELKSGSRYQAQTVAESISHFGLGPVQQSDILRVLFTNGIPQSVIQPRADQLVSELMVNKGSCPFVFGWNGERFAFITDLLWNAPLGLQLADGVLAPDRPWEYLKIRGDQCQARDGGYELRITEELWEAGYFDQVELIAVDHPPDFEVYSNEKVGPAEIAEPLVHTVRQRRQPASVKNHSGKDLSAAVACADGTMAAPFDRTIRKGRAENYFLEIDLGRLTAPRRIVLFLTGWIQPGDTSLNVAASHNSELPPGQPPSLWAPDSTGQWRQVRPFLGFPGGKPKTIAVDVTDAFQGNDYRLRIASNFELYWDEVFFTVDEEPAEVRQTPLALLDVDLHFRGTSAVAPYDGARPETYDYDQCETTVRWPPMQGRFTRYGPVVELLRAPDHRLVVMAAGDEMTLRFSAKPPPPDGWVRDFLLHNVGWDKDADLNTVWGQTVEPLPFVGMRGYPGAAERPAFADDREAAEYSRYLLDYQTRTSSAAPFWRAIGN